MLKPAYLASTCNHDDCVSTAAADARGNANVISSLYAAMHQLLRLGGQPAVCEADCP